MAVYDTDILVVNIYNVRLYLAFKFARVNETFLGRWALDKSRDLVTTRLIY